MNVSNKFGIDLLSGLSRMHENCLTNQRPWKNVKSVEHDQKYQNECIYQVRDQSL